MIDWLKEDIDTAMTNVCIGMNRMIRAAIRKPFNVDEFEEARLAMKELGEELDKADTNYRNKDK